MASGEPASVRHPEYKDSVAPPHVRQEVRASDHPEGDRFAGIKGETPFHEGNIALHPQGQQQLFHAVPPASSPDAAAAEHHVKQQ